MKKTGKRLRLCPLLKKIRMNSFAVKVFIAIFCCTIIPFYLIFAWIKAGYENYMKQEYSSSMISMLARGEENINSVFDTMANLSNAIVFDRDLLKTFQENADYYENSKVVDEAISQMIINNFINMDELVVTIFDNRGRIYTNWTTGYNNYDFLLEKPWVRQSQTEKGHIFWDLFSPGYVAGDEHEKYISLARAIYSNGIDGSYLGTVIISARQEVLSRILYQYLYDDKDCVYICDSMGRVILSIDKNHIITDEILGDAASALNGSRNTNKVIFAGGERYLVSAYNISKLSVLDLDMLRVIHFTNYNQIEEQVSGISGKINVYLAAGFALSVFASLAISRYVVRPVNMLVKQIDNYSIEDEVIMLDTKRSDEIGRLNRSYKEMSRKIKKLFEDLNHEYTIKEQYRYESMRAKINPHFLFNTLNTIRWMAIIRKADNITETIDALAGMLSYSMSKEGELVRLQDELDNIKNYVFIQNCRYGEKYQVEISVDEALLPLKVVRFILQPIVENAVIHAFKDYEGIGKIRIYGELTEGALKLYVEDNGNGMSYEQIQHLIMHEGNKNGEKSTGIGYANVDERIHVAYGSGYGLSVESSPGNGVKVIYTMPVIE